MINMVRTSVGHCPVEYPGRMRSGRITVKQL